MIRFGTLIPAILLFSNLGWAAIGAPPSFFDAKIHEPSGNPTLSYKPNEENFNKVFAAWGKLARSPANSPDLRVIEKSPNFKNFVKELKAVNSADGLNKFLVEWNQKYESLSDDPQTQYFVAQMMPLIGMRGILWRLRPVFEYQGSRPSKIIKAQLSGSKATHAFIVSALRQMAVNIEAYLPTDRWRAGFDFIASPHPEFTTEHMYADFGMFQEEVSQFLVPAFGTAADRVAKIAERLPADQALVWDNTLNYGDQSFQDGGRYTAHGQAEVRATASMLFFMQHSLGLFSAYDYKALPAVEAKVGKLYGIDGGEDVGMTVEDRIKAIRSFRSEGFLDRLSSKKVSERLAQFNGKYANSKFPDGAARLASAKKALDWAIFHAVEAHKLLSAHKDSKLNFGLNPVFYSAQNFPNLATGVKQLDVLRNPGPQKVSSNLTGVTVNFDLSAFYDAQKSPENLMDLFPTGFQVCKDSGLGPNNRKKLTQQQINDGVVVDSVESHEIPVKLANGMTEYRNYYCGRPLKWSNTHWMNYFPGADKKGPGYMRVVNETMMSSLGTNYLWLPMGNFF